jgi:hypothetical protein
MKSTYRWLLQTFLSAFGLLLILQSLILGLGLKTALNIYNIRQFDKLTTLAQSILIDPDNNEIPDLSYTESFFVFSVDGELKYTNRGKGRAIPEDQLSPVVYNGATAAP